MQFANEINSKYQPGDVVWIQPSNIKKTFQKALTIFSHLEFEKNIKFCDENSNMCLYPVTISDVFENYFDFNARPTTSFYEILHEFAKDPDEKQKLLDFSQIEADGYVIFKLIT